MPRFPRPAMAAHLEALLFDDGGEVRCWAPVAERNEIQRAINRLVSLHREVIAPHYVSGQLHLSRDEAAFLRYGQMVAALFAAGEKR